MKITKCFKFSKALHIATLCCFLLPFFYTGCGKSKDEKEAIEKATQDSVANLLPKYNTSIIGFGPSSEELAKIEKAKQDSIANIEKNCKDTIRYKTDTSNKQLSTQETSQKEIIPKKKQENLSQIICNRLPFFKPILVPKENVYSGIAIIIDLF